MLPATIGQALGPGRGQCRTDKHGGRGPEPLLLRLVYQMPPISVARSQFLPAAPGGDIEAVCPPVCTVAFTENQIVALPVPAGLAAVIRSEETLNLKLVPCKNPATQLRCDGTTVCSTARAGLLGSAVQNARIACLAALAWAAGGVPDTGGGDAWPKLPPGLEPDTDRLPVRSGASFSAWPCYSERLRSSRRECLPDVRGLWWPASRSRICDSMLLEVAQMVS